MAYLFDEAFFSQSVLSHTMIESQLILVRWDSSKPLGYGNCILLTRKEANEHAKIKVEEARNSYGEAAVNNIEQILQAQIKENPFAH